MQSDQANASGCWRSVRTGLVLLVLVGLSAGLWAMDCAGHVGRAVCSRRLDRMEEADREFRRHEHEAHEFSEKYRAGLVLCRMSEAEECPEDAEHGATHGGEPSSWTRAYPRFSEVVGQGDRSWCRFVSAEEAARECRVFVRDYLKKTDAEWREIQEWDIGSGERSVDRQREAAHAASRAYSCMSLFAPFSTGEAKDRWQSDW